MKKFWLISLCVFILLVGALTSCNQASPPPAETTAGVETEAGTVGDVEETVAESDSAETDPVETETQPGEDGDDTEAVTEEADAEETSPETTPSEEVTTDGSAEQVTEPSVAEWPRVRILFASKAVENVTIRAGEDVCEKYAAEELQKYLEKMGIAVVENGALTIQIQTDTQLPDDGYRISMGATLADGLTIAGGNGRGVIYGVYGFLEKKAGVRFFTPELETCSGKFISLSSNMLIEYAPVFENRHTDWYSIKTDADWLVKNGMNCSSFTDISDEMGSKWSYGSQFVHNICAVTNTDPNAQPCLTDPANLEYAIQYVRNRLAKEPGVNIITVSQMDNQNYCRCENCAAVDAEEGSPAGTLLRFVNAIARDIAVDYPDVVIDTLAYLYTRKAPAVTVPEPNVCIRLCSIECCFVHALDDPSCPENVAFCRDLVDWSEICDRIYIWDYTTNFCHYIPTFNNLQVMRENMHFRPVTILHLLIISRAFALLKSLKITVRDLILPGR